MQTKQSLVFFEFQLHAIKNR